MQKSSGKATSSDSEESATGQTTEASQSLEKSVEIQVYSELAAIRDKMKVI